MRRKRPGNRESFDKTLPFEHQMFIAHYLQRPNATRAYKAVRPHVSDETAATEGYTWLKKPEIAARIARHQFETVKSVELNGAELIKRDYLIATADIRELVEYRKFGCKHCWPRGTDPRDPPNIECAQCHGEGIGRTILRDTRALSDPAAAVFAGIKETKWGIEVKLADVSQAKERLYRHLGLFEKDNEQNQPNALMDLLKHLGKSQLPIVETPDDDGHG